MTYFKNLIIIFLAVWITNETYCQTSRENRKEKIEAQKIAYITNQLSLTSSEAQQFWPIYNEYQAEKKELQIKKRNTMMKYKEQDFSNNDDLEKIVDTYVNIQVNEAELLKKYHTKFKEVLSVEKVVKLYQAENQFKQFLLNQIKGQGAGEMRKQGNRF